MNKPAVFRRTDAVFICCVIAVFLLQIFSMLGMAISGLLFFLFVPVSLFYLGILMCRIVFGRKTSYDTMHGLHIVSGAALAAERQAIEHVTCETIERWRQATKFDFYDVCEHEDVWVIIMNKRYKNDGIMAMLFRLIFGNVVFVEKPMGVAITNTNYAHNLGHLIYENYAGTNDSRRAHDFARNHYLQ